MVQTAALPRWSFATEIWLCGLEHFLRCGNETHVFNVCHDQVHASKYVLKQMEESSHNTTHVGPVAQYGLLLLFW